MAHLEYEKSAWKNGFSIVAGIDEAGRGPLAGPVVAAAVVLKTVNFENRIDDSKRLTARQRQRAFSEIIKKSVFGIGTVDNSLIDKLNIAKATILAMRQALFNLFIRPDFALIDGIMEIGNDIPQRCIKRGDSRSLSIAAASIIAKVTRDDIMLKYHKQFPAYNFLNNKGYGTKEHVSILEKRGPCRIHRRSFKPIGGLGLWLLK